MPYSAATTGAIAGSTSSDPTDIAWLKVSVKTRKASEGCRRERFTLGALGAFKRSSCHRISGRRV